jgi:hypothetical protein
MMLFLQFPSFFYALPKFQTKRKINKRPKIYAQQKNAFIF